MGTGHNSKLRLLGISTVAGNQTVEKVTVNALGVVDAAGLHHISMLSPHCTASMQSKNGTAYTLVVICRCLQRSREAPYATSGMTILMCCCKPKAVT